MGIRLFYSSITTAAVTALDPSRASLTGGIIYMCQIAGGSIGLGLNTALIVTAGLLVEGIYRAFFVSAGLAVYGVVVAIRFLGGRVDQDRLGTMQHYHRAYAP